MIQVDKSTPDPAVIFCVSIGLAVFCIPWLRWKQPDWDRPIKVNLIFPIIYILATIFITVVPMIITPVETAIGLAIIATAVPVYFLFISWRNKPAALQRLSGSVTSLLQRLFVVVPPSKRD